MTRNEIEYNLKASPFFFDVPDTSVTFVFSSRLHLDKFKEKYIYNRNFINASLSKRFNIFIELNIVSDIITYTKIEKRGFLVKFKGSDFECLESLKFGGESLMSRNSNDL